MPQVPNEGRVLMTNIFLVGCLSSVGVSEVSVASKEAHLDLLISCFFS